jgi:hypothetical protein
MITCTEQMKASYGQVTEKITMHGEHQSILTFRDTDCHFFELLWSYKVTKTLERSLTGLLYQTIYHILLQEPQDSPWSTDEQLHKRGPKSYQVSPAEGVSLMRNEDKQCECFLLSVKTTRVILANKMHSPFYEPNSLLKARNCPYCNNFQYQALARLQYWTDVETSTYTIPSYQFFNRLWGVTGTG